MIEHFPPLQQEQPPLTPDPLNPDQTLGSVIAAHPLGEFIVKSFYPLVDAPPLLTRSRNQCG